jgi:GcrA cell cycle regulator
MTAAAIAREIGVSRSAVLGKVHRLGLGGRARTKSAKVASAAADGGRPCKEKVPTSRWQTMANGERADVIRRGVAMGKSAADLAAELETTTSAVRRAARNHDIELTRARKKGRKPQAAPSADVVPLRAIGLSDLTSTTCRWPIGDPLEAGFGFCGARCVAGEPYCAAHQAVAFAAPGVRP